MLNSIVFKSLIIALLVMMGMTSLIAQNANVSGIVEDGAGEKLSSATVILLQAADSVLVSFATTDNNGEFQIKRVRQGDYILQFSYLGFQTRNVEFIYQDERENIDLGNIVLEESTNELSEIEVVADYSPISIKKDTLEYNADAFKPKTHEVVEDLLKRLPGIEIDDEGNIKAQGEDVRKVLVDGKEFFGSDPKIATKNLPADAIKKVQVFDKKSDMAEFSGIDDGEEEKTINLELKPDRRKGVFGTITGGLGTEERYTGNSSINKFSQNEQLSFIGSVNNVNQQGFSFSDYVSFMGGPSNAFGRRSNTSGAQINQGLSNGFVQSGSLGLNYNRDFGTKTKLRSSYFYNHLDRDIDKTSDIENQLPDLSYFSNEVSGSNTLNNNHRVNFSLSHDLDSNQNIKFESSLTLSNANFLSESFGESFLLDQTPLNFIDRENYSDQDNLSTEFELIYRRKLGKPGRTISASASYGTDNVDGTGGLESENGFFDMGELEEVDSIFQDQNLVQKDKQYRLRASYTEPIGKGKYLEAALERSSVQNDLDKDVFDLENEQDIFNPELSQNYISERIYDRAGVGFRITKNALNLSFGLDGQRTLLQGEIMSSENIIEKESYYLLPEMRLRYEFSASGRLMFDYRTRVNDPSITQLQPIVDNTDPTNIYIGNPDLKPEYAHSLNLRFHSFSQFSQVSFFGSIGFTLTENNITNARNITPDFIRTTMPLNTDQATATRLYLGAGLPLRFIKSRLSVNGNVSHSQSDIFISFIEDNTQRWNTGVQVRLNNQKREILEWGLSGRVSYNTTQYEIQSSQNQNYINQQYGADLRINFLKNWSVGGNFNYNIYGSSLNTDQIDVPLAEAFLSRDFMDKRLRITLAAFDLFNRNEGIEQIAELNYLEETRIQSLGRYFMLSARYSLNKFGGNEGPKMQFIRH